MNWVPLANSRPDLHRPGPVLATVLDGTLARVRNRQRPRYGYYVDHVLDAVGFVALFGGLILGGHMSPAMGLGFMAAYFLLVVEIALATHARGTFRMSAWGMGPTELRIVLAIGTLQLMRTDFVSLFGHRWLLFDVGGAAGIAGLLLTFVVSRGVALYQEERPTAGQTKVTKARRHKDLRLWPL